MVKANIKKSIFGKVTAIALGLLVFSNAAIMGVQAAFPNDSYYTSYITGDGVALRKGPGTSSTRLELMYRNESVRVNINYDNINGWSNVKRAQTGSVGYTASQYIY